MCFCVIGGESQSRLVLCYGLVQSALAIVDHSQVGVSSSISFVQMDNGLELFSGLVQFTPLGIGIAQAKVSLSQSGIKACGCLKFSDGLIPPLSLHVAAPQLKMRRGILGGCSTGAKPEEHSNADHAHDGQVNIRSSHIHCSHPVP